MFSFLENQFRCAIIIICRRYLNMDGLLAIAIDPSYISKSGKKTPHTFLNKVGRVGRKCQSEEVFDLGGEDSDSDTAGESYHDGIGYVLAL